VSSRKLSGIGGKETNARRVFSVLVAFVFVMMAFGVVNTNAAAPSSHTLTIDEAYEQ
jgi:hypothetical protein